MPKMTRSHYNLIADVIAAFRGKIENTLHDCLCSDLANALAGTSSQLKLDRFRDRCAGIRRGR